jgi:hypothetical protein
VCHQTVSLAARHLEQNGIATIVMGCAKDIVEYCGVPRFLFSDFPLGNAAGRPKDPQSQAFTLKLALRVLESAPVPRTTVQSPAALERRLEVEARLFEYRAPFAGGNPAPTRRFRPAKGDRQDGPRRHRGSELISRPLSERGTPTRFLRRRLPGRRDRNRSGQRVV